VLSCPQEAAPGELHELALRANEGASSFAHDDVTYLASHRTLMLEPEYADRNWSVVAMELESDALAPMAGLESLLFAMTGSRCFGRRREPDPGQPEFCSRSTRCAKSCAASAKRTSRSRRRRRQSRSRRLAQSFNTMAARLGGEFTALMTLADIDQAILSRLDLDRVIETVVMRMRESFRPITSASRSSTATLRDGANLHARSVARRRPRARAVRVLAVGHGSAARLSRRTVARRRAGRDAVSRAGREARRRLACSCCRSSGSATSWDRRPGLRQRGDADRRRARPREDLGERVGVAFATAPRTSSFTSRRTTIR
jgi:hypothetical protein